MKTKLLYFVSMLCLILASCSDEDSVLTLSQQDFKDIPCEGRTFEIDVNSETRWAAKSLNEDWITVTKSGKAGESVLRVQVQGNLGESSRTGGVVVSANGVENQLTFTQLGKPASDELEFRLPIVFHVLYADAKDEYQNIPTEKIYQILDFVNATYAAQEHIKLQFVPAVADPSGNALLNPGINRVQWISSVIHPVEFMQVENSGYMHLLWDPNKYVNVFLYNFSIDQILGISTFPLTTKSHPLDGTDVVEDMNIQLKDLTKMRCVSLNSSWIMRNASDPLGAYIPRNLLSLQTHSGVTLSHELGHYFGLRHVFSESNLSDCVDTDYCEDTPSYNKDAYDANNQYIWQESVYNPNFANEFQWKSVFMRTSCKDDSQFESHNLMDYSYGYMDQFTKDQCDRMRHVLNYSPMIPGPKQTRASLTRTINGPIELPHQIAICEQPHLEYHK